MGWVSPITWSACSVVTAAQLNQQLRDNLNQTFPALVTTQGDAVYATGANAGQRVAVGVNGAVIIGNSGCSAGVSYNTQAGSPIRLSASLVGIQPNSPSLANDAGLLTYLLDSASNWGGMGSYNNGDTWYRGGGHAFFTGGATNTCPTRAMYLTGCTLFIGAASSNAKQTGGAGLTIRQGLTNNNSEIFSLKNVDSNHGITQTETDTFFSIQPSTAGTGNPARVRGYGSTAALWLTGHVLTEDTSHAVGDFAPIYLEGLSGTSSGSLSGSANIAAIATAGVARFFFRADGTSYEHVGTAWVNFDEHDDLALLNMTAAHLSRDPIRENFGAWLNTNRQQLQDLNLVEFNEDGGHFVNRSRMQELLVGNARQQGERTRQLEARIAQLERLLLSPPSSAPPVTT